MNKKQQASLLSAYTMLDSSFKEYRNKVAELYGETTDQHIEYEIEKDHLEEKTEDKQLFYEERSGRYFESTLFDVQKAEYYINRKLMMADFASLNEWYEELDLDIVEEGDALGWSPCMLMDYYWQPWLDFDHEHWTTKDGRDCITIRFWQEPTTDWEDYC